MSDDIRVTQLFDCADVGKTIVNAGVRQGKPWRIIQGPWTRGGTKAAYYRFRLEQAVAFPRTQLWHVNMGGRAKWARGTFSRPYALTLHGTDIRESYWRDQHHKVIKEDIDRAGHVWYTTPDLREKAEQVRSDAEYLPAPVDMDELPVWTPAVRPRIVFPSRWDGSKGGDALLQTAADVVSAVGTSGDVDIVGLDWGDRAPEAAALGIKLLPKMDKSLFLQELATAHVAVGQVTGVLGLSELQAVGIGVPLIFADPFEDYISYQAIVGVARSEVAQAVRDSLRDPVALSRKLGGPAYVSQVHSPKALIPRLEAGYAKVLEAAA